MFDEIRPMFALDFDKLGIDNHIDTMYDWNVPHTVFLIWHPVVLQHFGEILQTHEPF